jgi:predicted enzyme related to lactoylglutathione lyase
MTPTRLRRLPEAGRDDPVGPIEVPGGDRVAMMMDPQGAAFAVHSKKPGVAA